MHNVAHKISKGLKHKIHPSKIGLYNLIANFTFLDPIFGKHEVLLIEKYYSCSVNL